MDAPPSPPPSPSPPAVTGHVVWSTFEQQQPELAAAVRARFEAAKHHVLATLRADGAPRVSGTEVILAGGVLAVGSMWQAVKALDLQRDGRFALHANPGDGSMEGGDAKVSGTAVELTGKAADALVAQLPMEVPQPFHLFRLDLAQVVLSEVDHERNCMVIRSWRPERGVVVVER